MESEQVERERKLAESLGWQLAQRLRQEKMTAPIVMISADAREGQQEEGSMRPHNDYLIKPVGVNTLLERLAGLLDIQWLYEPETPPAVTLPPDSLQQADLPPPAVIQQLRTMAEIGHLQGLRKKLRELQQDASISQPFLMYLETAIQQVRLDRIRELSEVQSA